MKKENLQVVEEGENMDRLKINNIPSPIEILKEETTQLIEELPDGNNLDGLAMSIYIEEMKKLKNNEDGSFSETQKKVAKEYLSYLLQTKAIEENKKVEDDKALLISNLKNFQKQIKKIEENLNDLDTRLETIGQTIKQQTHKTNAEKVMNEEARIETLHFEDIRYLKGETRRKAENYNRILKARTTTEIAKKYKLSDKSLGYRYLILLGANQIDLKGNRTR